jgi:predicted nucleic acid-binding protein
MLLVDSDVLIHHLRGNQKALEFLVGSRRAQGRLKISVLTIVEITGGMRTGQRRAVWALLGSLDRLPVDDLVARRAGEFARRFRRSHSGVGLVDYVIAATADVHGLELATLNVKHFPMFESLRPAF